MQTMRTFPPIVAFVFSLLLTHAIGARIARAQEQLVPFWKQKILEDFELHPGSSLFPTENFRRPTERDAPALGALLKDDDKDVRVVALRLLRDMKAKAKPALVFIVGALDDETRGVRKLACQAIAAIGASNETIEEKLAALLDEADPGVSLSAAEAYWILTKKSGDVIRVLDKNLGPDGKLHNIHAVELTAKLGPAASELVPKLVETMRTSSCTPGVKYLTANALAEIGPAAKDAVQALKAELKNEDATVRAFAARGIWKITDDYKAAVPMLLKILTEERDYIYPRKISGQILGEMKSAHREVFGHFVRLLSDKDWLVRAIGAQFFGESGIRDDAVLAALEKAMTDKNKHVQVIAAQSHWQITQDTKATMPVLLAAIKDKDLRFDEIDPHARVLAVRVLGRMGALPKEVVLELRAIREPVWLAEEIDQVLAGRVQK